MNFAGVQSITIPEGDVRSIAIGGVTAWQKPNPLPYDALVEYVESDGTQYVDTGVVPDSATTRMEIRAVLAQSASSVQTLFGSRSAVNRNAYNCLYYPAGMSGAYKKVLRYDFGDSGTVSNIQNIISAIDSGWANIETSGNAITIAVDGETPVTTTAKLSSASNSYSIYLFAVNTGGTATTTATPVRIASARIYSGSTLVRSFAPCRVGTAGALYDRVTDTVFRSATSTPLVAGPDKNGG